MSTHAPIALFVFNRPFHTTQTLIALRANTGAAETDLHVFSDGPRNDDDRPLIEEVRALVRGTTGFRSVTLVERTENLGLARSIIAGVTQLCAEHGRVIVVEDDLVTSRHFLDYMNRGLDLYAADERVASIHGYMYPVKAELPETFFLRGADCWGWATWKRAWDHFDPDGAALLRRLRAGQLTHRFDYDGNSSFVRMLRNQVRGKNNSWAIRWHASAFLRDMLTLYPARSLVVNTGFDSSGTHCSDADYYTTLLGDTPIDLQRVPVEENAKARAAVVVFFRGVRRKWWLTAWRTRGARLLRKAREALTGRREGSGTAAP